MNNEECARIYTNEWARILLLSEPLDSMSYESIPCFTMGENVKCRFNIIDVNPLEKINDHNRYKITINQNKTNLNRMRTYYSDKNQDENRHIIDNNIIVDGVSLEIHFRNIEEELIKQINCADAVVGCVAWLTNKNILNALKKVKYGVSIIVQKEDFLRPDCDDIPKLKEMYDDIKGISWYCGFTVAFECTPNPGLINCASYQNHYDDPVRCMGNHNKDIKPAFPRMHNKFIVFGKIIKQKRWCDKEEYGDHVDTFQAFSVWSGSYNFTHNSANSLENGIMINNSLIANQYLNTWAHVLTLSEQLDWDSEWSAPELRIGT